MLHFDSLPPAVAKLLAQLVQLPVLQQFALGGGTSLALRLGHRLSVDLDFFSTETFEPENVANDLSVFPIQQLNRAPNTLSLSFDGIKVDILRHSYPLLKPIENFNGVHLLSLHDVAAMKINAAINRGSKKDFYDLHELVQHLSLNRLLALFEQKYSQSDRFLALRSLAYFDDAEIEPDPISHRNRSWSEIKRGLTNAIREIQ
jgi:predicted nucleotidyltransferase component of viral defense system